MIMDNESEKKLLNLENYSFQEILGNNSSNKVVFVLVNVIGSDPLESDEKQQAIIIFDKEPFVDDAEKWPAILIGAKLEFLVRNDIYSSYIVRLDGAISPIKATLIYPITQKLIDKYRFKERFVIRETDDDYRNITLPYLEQNQHSLQWVYNFLEHKAEQDRIVFEDSDPETGFLLAPDLKWDGKQLENLYLLAIVVKRGIKSIRDLRSEHLPLLRNVRDRGLQAISSLYKIRTDQLNLYFHYQPSFYHLHVHFVSIKYDAPGGSVLKAILLDDVISHLEIHDQLYAKTTLSFLGKQDDPLLELFRKAGRLNP